ncbi:MAG TPA: hypothetical protein VJP40_01585, partial [bacterium]|nr:hypothetical protein [bacterium]
MVSSLPNLGRGLPVSEPAGAFAPGEVLSRLGPTAQTSAELRSLSRESDPVLFYQALLSHAGRLERQGRTAESQAILEVIAAGSSEASVAGRARSRLQAFQGTGAIGGRAEVLLGRFAQEVTEPAALFAMGGAGAIYRVSRFSILARMGAAPASLATRGIGGRALASSLAFAAEATSFPLLVRTGNIALGRSQEWSAQQLSHEIAASFFALGGLKLAGGGAAALQRRLGPSHAASLLGPVFRQTAMFGGILAGHRMEEWAGLRPAVDGATTAVDGLALLLQFNVAGRLSQRLFGQGFQSWERELDRRSEILGSTP